MATFPIAMAVTPLRDCCRASLGSFFVDLDFGPGSGNGSRIRIQREKPCRNRWSYRIFGKVWSNIFGRTFLVEILWSKMSGRFFVGRTFLIEFFWSKMFGRTFLVGPLWLGPLHGSKRDAGRVLGHLWLGHLWWLISQSKTRFSIVK